MIRRWIKILSIAGMVLLGGCTAKQQEAKIDFLPPKYVEQTPPKEMRQPFYNPGSLYGRGENPLFSDKKAMKINDIVTITIDEAILSQSSGTKSLSKTTQDSLGGGVMTAPEGGFLGNVANTFNKAANINMAIDSGTSFTGSGTNNRSEQFTTNISARIVKILENGNYFIDGRREMLLDGQKQILHISGVIRPDDISITNEIDSKYISDAKILYETQGDIKQVSERGWGTKMVESVWPF